MKAVKLLAAVAVLAVIIGAVFYFYVLKVEGEASGTACIEFHIRFADGTEANYTSTQAYMGELGVAQPMSVFTGGKAIESLTIAVKARLENMSCTHWVCLVTQRVELYKAGQTMPLLSSTGEYSKTGESWQEGVAKTMVETTLTGEQIETAVNSAGGAGNYYLQAVAVLSLTLTAENNVAVQLAGGVVGGLNISCNDSGEALSITGVIVVSPLS